jgi:uncharacterized iron-regulated membrane protein
MSRNKLKAWYWVHKWSSLIPMVFLLMLCITGLPLIFSHEIDHWLHDVEVPPVAAETLPASVDEIVDAAKDRNPGQVVQFLVADADEPDILFVRLGTSPVSADMSAFLTYDARTGDFLYDYPLGQGFMDVMLRLHVDVYAGLPGTLFLGVMGFLLLVSLVSGAVLYAPFMRKLPFGRIRTNRSRRIWWLDSHNFLGIVTLAWLFVVSATGVVNTLSVPIFGQWQATELAAMIDAHRGDQTIVDPVSLDTILETANSAMPGKTLSFLAFPGNEFAGPHHYVAFMQGTTPLSSKLLTPVMIDADSGDVLEKRELPWYVSALLLSQPLHFGDYGGWPLKVLWALLDILAIAVLSSGIYLWLKGGNGRLETLLARLEADRQEQPAVAGCS